MPANCRARVLCVDDNDDSREMLCLLLRSSGIEVKAVATADQALSSIQIERFDLYLLDAWLPDLDGFELCRRIRRRLPHTPILFFSGAAYETDKQRGLEAGANTYVIKPDLSGLLEAGLIAASGTVAATRARAPTRKPRKTTARVSVIGKCTSAISVRRTTTDTPMELAVTSVWETRSSGDSTASPSFSFLLSDLACAS
jgi:DNA-binding response OmpR family regulator